jgi:FdhD protein
MTSVDDARPGRTAEAVIVRHEGTQSSRDFDRVTVEEPLELRLVAGERTQSVAVTMRTPGGDFELAAGFLNSEGIVSQRSEIASISYCVDPAIDPQQQYNIVNVELRSAELARPERFERHFTMNSSCGICGRASLEALHERGVKPLRDDVRIEAAILYVLPERMRTSQRVFETTGGLHGAALFDAAGTAIAVREDIGRHNAVDKLTGWAFLEGRSLEHHMLCVSGRASYEIVQKAAVARIPIVCAVSAPSSLAVDLAREFNITLAAFVRGQRANVYTATERII